MQNAEIAFRIRRCAVEFERAQCYVRAVHGDFDA
jgi:hypothetical protein